MAWRVWHLVVPNEAGLLSELMNTLTDIILLDKLSSPDRLSVEFGAVRFLLVNTAVCSPFYSGLRALGQMVVDLGDTGMLKMMPILHRHLAEASGAEKSHTRKAVCLGFSEVLRRADKQYIGAYLNEIVKTVSFIPCFYFRIHCKFFYFRSKTCSLMRTS